MADCMTDSGSSMSSKHAGIHLCIMHLTTYCSILPRCYALLAVTPTLRSPPHFWVNFLKGYFTSITHPLPRATGTSVCGPRSTVIVLVLCAIDLHALCCCVLKASTCTRVRMVGGQGVGLSTSPRCYTPLWK